MMLKLYRHSGVFVYMLLILALSWFAGCKKDLLQWARVEQIGPYTDGRFNRIFFSSDMLGFVVGGSRFHRADVLITRDGGHSWLYRSFPEAAKGLYGIAQAPSGGIYITGFDGKLLFSVDDGHNWEFRQLGYLPVKALAFNGENEGIMAGGISFDQGFFFRIDEAGHQLSYDSVGYEINDIQMIDGSTGYMAGYGVCLKTTDGGYSWMFTSLRSDNFTALHCPDKNTIWVCGYEGSIYKSGNAGQTWERMRNGNDLARKKYRLLDIVFPDPQHGYAVGENGVVIYSDDGGQNWMEFTRFTDVALRSIAVSYDGSLLVAGDNGAFYRLRR